MQAQQVFHAYQDSQRSTSHPYRYCPLCGKELENGRRGNQERKLCPQCGWVHYQNPYPGVSIVIMKDDKVLLGKRNQSSFAAGKWCLPGGFVEFEENYMTAAIREVAEETGLDVCIQSILSVVTNYLSPTLHTLVVVLLATVQGGSLTPGDDIGELGWFAADGPLPEMAFAADEHIIRRYWQDRLSGAPVDPRYATLPNEMEAKR